MNTLNHAQYYSRSKIYNYALHFNLFSLGALNTVKWQKQTGCRTVKFVFGPYRGCLGLLRSSSVLPNTPSSENPAKKGGARGRLHIFPVVRQEVLQLLELCTLT